MCLPSIASPIACPLQKVCGNYHVANVIIFPINNAHCNAYCMKSKAQKLDFLHGSIATNNKLMLLTIEGKWLKAIVHMARMHSLIFVFQNRSNSSLQITFIINSNSHSHLSLLGIKKTFNNFFYHISILNTFQYIVVFQTSLFEYKETSSSTSTYITCPNHNFIRKTIFQCVCDVCNYVCACPCMHQQSKWVTLCVCGCVGVCG